MYVIKRLLNDFLVAIGFLSRLPIAQWVSFNPVNLQRSSYYFPVVAWLLSLLLVIMYSGFSYIFPQSISVFLIVLCGVIVTGALHEDGLADVCDALGVMGDHQKKLTVMKDSRLGTFGVVGLVLVIMGKILLLTEQSNIFIAILLCVFLSRMLAFSMMLSNKYIKTQGTKTIGFTTFNKNWFVLVLIVAALPVYFLITIQQIIILIVLFIFLRLFLLAFFQKQFGGVNGDCLGFTQQTSELIILLVLL
ncbi:adenosylcobinamide-GDP ribazoletransferase [Marinicellulosiphila megalodicopiae]|uniref:adenosylcobinamide-GDP ribazoletransferase n=1 Tax=Marinicellulosiphila megalodicopiae TaxID=2724896 RepID=UPI003BAF00CF